MHSERTTNIVEKHSLDSHNNWGYGSGNWGLGNIGYGNIGDFNIGNFNIGTSLKGNGITVQGTRTWTNPVPSMPTDSFGNPVFTTFISLPSSTVSKIATSSMVSTTVSVLETGVPATTTLQSDSQQGVSLLLFIMLPVIILLICAMLFIVHRRRRRASKAAAHVDEPIDPEPQPKSALDAGLPTEVDIVDIGPGDSVSVRVASTSYDQTQNLAFSPDKLPLEQQFGSPDTLPNVEYPFAIHFGSPDTLPDMDFLKQPPVPVAPTHVADALVPEQVSHEQAQFPESPSKPIHEIVSEAAMISGLVAAPLLSLNSPETGSSDLESRRDSEVLVLRTSINPANPGTASEKQMAVKMHKVSDGDITYGLVGVASTANASEKGSLVSSHDGTEEEPSVAIPSTNSTMKDRSDESEPPRSLKFVQLDQKQITDIEKEVAAIIAQSVRTSNSSIDSVEIIRKATEPTSMKHAPFYTTDSMEVDLTEFHPPAPTSHVVIIPYYPTRPDEMLLQAGDLIGVEKSFSDGWARVQNISQGRIRAMVPMAVLVPIKSGPTQNVQEKRMRWKNEHQEEAIIRKSIPERTESLVRRK